MNDIERAMRALREQRRAHEGEGAARSGEKRDRHGSPPRRFDEIAFAADLIVSEGSRSGSARDVSTPDVSTPEESAVIDTDPAVKSPSGSPAESASDLPDEASPGSARLPTGLPGHPSGSPSGRSMRLPLERLARDGFVTPNLPKGRLSEEYRRVKRPILRAIADGASGSRHPNIVAVTSSLAGEGKTYTAINLAMSLAMERERTVLLIDADVLKGTAGRILGVDDASLGLTDLLSSDDRDLSEVILATEVPNLRLVPAGKSTDQATELLSSVRMRQIVDELAVRYSDRVIVLDCPPIMQTNEANVIVEHAGQVVFVVAAEETDPRIVLEAMRHFDENRSVGILLNKVRARRAGNYGYDYGYGND